MFFFFAGWWWLYIIVSGQICSCVFILSSHYTVYGNYYRFQSFFLPLKIKCNQPTYGELKNKKMPWYGEAIFKVGQACDGGTPHDRWLSCKLPWFCGTQLRWWKKSCTHLISRLYNQYLQGFIHPQVLFRSSSINSIIHMTGGSTHMDG